MLIAMASQELDRRGMSVLSLAHVVDDINQSALPALLPFLIAGRHLSYTAAAGLMLFASLSSSIVQPAIGHLSDRRSMPWLIALGVLLAGGGFALAGTMPSYFLIALCVGVSGFGIAMFHPEAARFANYVAGAKKATGMRWFAVGGNVGFALGPLVMTPALLAFGPSGTLVMIVPAVLMAIAVLVELPRLQTFAPPRSVARISLGRDDWSAFGRLTAYVSLRSMAYIGMVAFTPLVFIDVLHTNAGTANTALSAFLIAGAFGTIVGGRLADRVGRRAMLLGSVALSAPLLWLLSIAANAHVSVLLAAALLCALGFTLVASQTAFVVLGQEYLPNRLGIASGVTLGLAISLGGAFSPVLGWIGDHHGLVAVLDAIVVLLLLALAAGLTLPRTARRATLSAVPEIQAAPALRT
jgi:FSR family fosmidomycin resistance protein-like MFS transporter